MLVITRVGQLARRLIRGIIHRLWVLPLETQIIPRLSVEETSAFKRLLLRMSMWFANVGRVLLEDLRVDILRWRGTDWSITYIGNGYSAEALGYLLFPEPPETRGSLQAYLWQVPGLVRKFAGEGDLVVCELNRIIRLSPKNVDLSFTTPQWIKQVLEGIDRPLDDIIAGVEQHTRSRIRRLESQNYHFITTYSEVDFDFFYNRMLIPYVVARHGGRGAIMHNYDYVHSYFEKGTLLITQQDGEPVSGCIFQLKDGTCKGFEMGVIDGRVELVKQGLTVVTWWFILTWAREHRAHRFDLGCSRPMVSDGVFTFKRQWGTKVLPYWEAYSQWNFFAKDISPILRDFLNEKGFISEISERHYQVVLLTPGEVFDEARLAKQLKTLSKYGLAGVILVSNSRKDQLIPCTAVEIGPDGYAYLALDKVKAN